MNAADSFSIAALITSGITSIGNSYADSQAKKAVADYQAGMARVNKMLSEVQADEAITRGDFLAGEIQRKGDQQTSYLRRKAKAVEGSQKVSYAAQGVETTSGTPADVIAESKFLSDHEESLMKRNTATDILTIKSNAWREAWGLKTQALSYDAQAAMAGITGSNQARQSLISGGLNSLNYGLRAFGRYKMSAPSGDSSGELKTYDEGDSSGDGFFMPGGH